MKENFKDIALDAARNNPNAVEKLVKRLQPMITRSANIAGYEGGESDLIIFLLESLRKMNVEKMSQYHEGQIVQLFRNMLYHKAIDLYRKNIRKKSVEFTNNEIELIDKENPFSDIFFYDMISNLRPKQKQVVIGKIIFGLSDVQIGELLQISRQSVNRLYNRAIEELRKEVE